MYFVAVVAHICTKQYKLYIYVKRLRKKCRVTVLRFFAVYSNYGSSVNIYQGHRIPDFN